MVSMRFPRDLEELVDAYAEHAEVNFSEAVRQLLVRALDGMGATVTEDFGSGPHENRSWAEPLPGEVDES